MRWRVKPPLALLVAASAVALWPALAQRVPESILPPGFGQPEPGNSVTPSENASEPAESTEIVDDAVQPTRPVSKGDVIGAVIDGLADNALVAEVVPEDLPPSARRSLDRVGLIDAADGGLGDGSFGQSDGRFLTALMRSIDAPLASRWASILLRRALLSTTSIPAGVGGADWVAERAWLLVRMGEADTARALVARVDAENFTPKLYAVAMQAALATGDPASLCGVTDAAARVSDEPSWPLAQAMCAGLSGEPGTASAMIDRVRDRRRARGIDVLLAEKVVGAGTNARRAVMIQWDGVETLNAWRYGLATATGITVPPELFATVGPQVGAWYARAPLLTPATRATSVGQATALGVMSSAALVDFHGAIWDTTDPADRSGTTAEQLRVAYSGNVGARIAALKALWGDARIGTSYARQLLTARAAASFPLDGAIEAAETDTLIAAMLSAGLDLQAAPWAAKVAISSPGWAMLSVATPRALDSVNAGAVRGVSGGEDDRRTKLLLAGLAGLGRLTASEASQLAERYAVPLARPSSWTRALDRAVAAREPATVALIAAAGLQARAWRHIPPEHLFHIVAALRQVGLEPEARMIAAEAVARI